MRLIDIYGAPGGVRLTYQLMEEREPHQNISHVRMPSVDGHLDFMCSRPYLHWYAIQVGQQACLDAYVGAIYLSKKREIGVGILKAHRRQGYAEAAIRELMRLHPGRFLANINPANEVSIALFRKLGFGGPIQITLEKPE